MPDAQLTVRLNAVDMVRILRIASTLRERLNRPFVTRTEAIRFALEAVGDVPDRFIRSGEHPSNLTLLPRLSPPAQA